MEEKNNKGEKILNFLKNKMDIYSPEKYCCICGLRSNLKQIPDDLQGNIDIQSNYIIEETDLMCMSCVDNIRNGKSVKLFWKKGYVKLKDKKNNR